MKYPVLIFFFCLMCLPNALCAQSAGEMDQTDLNQIMQSSTSEGCTEPYRSARVKRPFDVARAYPPYAVMMEIQGTLDATIFVESDGKIGEIQFVNITPPGVFDSHSMEEIGKMQFEPAQLDCQSVGGFYRLRVNFMLQ